MSINDESIRSHRFVASGSAFGPAWERSSGTNARKYWLGGFFVIVGFMTLTLMGPTLGLPAPILGPIFTGGFLLVVVVLGVGSNTRIWRRSRSSYAVDVSGDALTVDGTVYPWAEAQLSLWVRSGVALLLRSGQHQFLLGGQDRPISPSTPLDGPPVQFVDAWLPTADFDRLLSLSGRWSGPAGHSPAAGEPARCLLYPNALQLQKMGPFAFGKKQRLHQSLAQPQLFLDVDDETIRVIDPNNGALLASASLSRATASPATYELGGGQLFPSLGNLASNSVSQYYSRSAAMSLCVGGIAPMTIGCRGFTDMVHRRFSWSSDVPVVHDPPEYETSIADWLTLVDKLGLDPYLVDTAR